MYILISIKFYPDIEKLSCMHIVSELLYARTAKLIV